MKETYRPYSAAVITLKAAILPITLGIIDVLCEQKISAEYLTPIAGLFKALSVALIEIIFLFLVGIIAALELRKRKAANASEISELEGLLEGATPAETREINQHLKKLKSERINLIPK